MTLDDFKNTLSYDFPPPNINSLLTALWWDAKGDWKKAHGIAQDIHTKNGALLHAYLHRLEGDIFNADYWYSRAGENHYKGSVEAEWQTLAQRFLMTGNNF